MFFWFLRGLLWNLKFSIKRLLVFRWLLTLGALELVQWRFSWKSLLRNRWKLRYKRRVSGGNQIWFFVGPEIFPDFKFLDVSEFNKLESIFESLDDDLSPLPQKLFWVALLNRQREHPFVWAVLPHQRPNFEVFKVIREYLDYLNCLRKHLNLYPRKQNC